MFSYTNLANREAATHSSDVGLDLKAEGSRWARGIGFDRTGDRELEQGLSPKLG